MIYLIVFKDTHMKFMFSWQLSSSGNNHCNTKSQWDHALQGKLMVWEAWKNIQNALRQALLWQGGNHSRPKNSIIDLWLTHLPFSRESYPLLSMPVKPAIPLTATVQATKDGLYTTARIIISKRNIWETHIELSLPEMHEGGTELEEFKAMPDSTRFPWVGTAHKSCVCDQPEVQFSVRAGAGSLWELATPPEVRAAEVLGE